MNILDFMPEYKEKKIQAMKNSGMDEYAIERKLEEDKVPEKLEKYDPVDNSQYQQVTFFFNNDDFEQFKDVFEVLEYVEVNSNQSWLMMGLIRLIKEGKIMVSYDEKKVWVN